MKRKFQLLFLMIFLVIFSQSFLTAQEKPFTLVFYDDYAPFSFPVNGKNTGMLVDILTEVISKRLNLPLEIKMGPWVRMQEMVKSGEADAFCTNVTQARKEYAIPGEVPTITTYYKIFVAKNNPKFAIINKLKTIDDVVAGAKAGNFTLGTFIGEGWTATHLTPKGVEVDFSPQQEIITKKVAYLRNDICLNNAIVQRYSIKLLLEKEKAEQNQDEYKKIQNIVELDPIFDEAK